MKRNHLWIVAPLTALFLLVAALVLQGAAAEAEAWVYERLAALISPGLTVLMRTISRLCDPLPVAAICLALLLHPRTRKGLGAPLAVTAGAAGVTGRVLKNLFVRERPDILRLVTETGFSFPSGHSTTSAAMGTALALTAARMVKKKGRRRLLIGLSILYPLAVGVSRIYLGVHHAGDVLGGWLLGTAIGIVCFFACSETGKKWAARDRL